ncbi:MAG: homocysteine S-methyltransferase family protein [Candidatus Omnitrophica bacterium]|jgi:5-methyltetrahydrofolate--homocysteine methyltransferase|nr:homocysteine S-methyltransferase family protein [Candidatus Omnitrophota bacterium]
MNAKEKIKRLLKKRVVILDGAMGTQLHKYGMPQGILPEIWALENPRILKQIHRQYRQAGSDIIYTATFGANRIKLGNQKIKNVKQINKDLCLLAKEAAGKNCFVAGDIGPLGVFIEPFGELPFEEAVDIFKEQVRSQLLAGVDLFVIETMMDIQEARAALIAVREFCDKFTIVTMTYEASGRTLNGTSPQAALITLQSLGADCVGANCSTGPVDMLKIVKSLKPYATVPLAVKPNAGMPELVFGQAHFSMQPRDFGVFAEKFASYGVNMLGGCCGTTPEHIREAKIKIGNKKPIAPHKKQLSALSSARSALILEKQKDVLIVGESINPTGKPAFQQELKKGKMASVVRLANEQKQNGANLLDVNVSVPQANEEKLMMEAISVLSKITNLPLVIDSPNVKVIERALRFYPGRALINSISEDPVKLKPLLNLAKKYGAMFIVLPVAGRAIPKNIAERKNIIKKIFNEAKKSGFYKEDLIVDCLVLTVSSKPQAAQDVLKTISWCKKIFKANTIIGLSNISFGLPKRDIVNTTFLNMAKGRGLSLAIANPLQKKNFIDLRAKALLLNKKNAAANFINCYSGKADSGIKYRKHKKFSPEEEIYKAVIEGNKQDIAVFIRNILKEGKKPLSIMQDILIPAIIKVGDLFEKKEYFLPQLIASAEAMKLGTQVLLPYIKRKGGEKKKAIVILATVEGDVHDIGKNIVSLLLENHGFKIIDLGKDVSAQKIIQAIKVHKPDIVGLSALMTTTMVNMKKVIELAKREGLKCEFMIGGAVVTKHFADSIDAAYAKDGVSAVRVAQNLSSNTYLPSATS